MTDTALQQPEAEQAVIGALLLDSLALAKVRPLLPVPAAFADRPRALIYAAILRVFDAGHTVDHVTLMAELREDKLEDPDLLLAELIDYSVTSANIEAYAKLVLDAWRRRQAVAEADRLRKAATDPALDLADVVADTCSRLVPIGTGTVSDKPRSLPSVFLDTLEDLERRTASGHQILGIPTGLEGLDELTDGWTPGKLTILAARPSRGKTSLALHFALAAARVAPVDIVSMEMTEDELVARILQAEVGKDMRHLRRDAELLARFAPALHRASADLSRLPLAIDCRSRTPARIRMEQQALTAQRGRPAGLIIVDYLGLMDPDQPAQNRDRELGSITKALKAMSRDLMVQVLLLCQLNRSSDREARPPELFDLRDSGNIEQDANDVLMLHWPDGKPEHGAAAVDLYVRKNRNGHTGKVPLMFEPWTQRWFETSESSRGEAA